MAGSGELMTNLGILSKKTKTKESYFNFMYNEARKKRRGCMTIPWKKYSAFTKTKD